MSQTTEVVFKNPELGFIPLKLSKVEVLSHNTKFYRFSFDNPKALSGLGVASCVSCNIKNCSSGEVVNRPYTPVSRHTQTGHVDFVIKTYPKGAFTQILDKFKPGDVVEFQGPLMKFAYKPNQFEHIVMIAGGTGITPMYQVIPEVLLNPNDKTKITLLYGNHSEEDILLRNELTELQTAHPHRLTVHHYLSKPSDKWTGGKGQITAAVIKANTPPPSAGDKVKIMVCGPPPMLNAISGDKPSVPEQGELKGALKELGYCADQVYKF